MNKRIKTGKNAQRNYKVNKYKRIKEYSTEYIR